ncbi:MAG TPA: YfiR family protein [Geothrix sp.]|nr:YfiR family protein [Geothrix sp.]
MSLAALQEARRSEEEAIAMLLCHLGDYAVWPEPQVEDARKPFIIGVIGDFPTRRELLRQTANKRVHGRKIEIVWLESLKPTTLLACQILYICDSEQDRLREILSMCRSHPILTVAGSEGFAREGVMLDFFVKESRLNLAVNLTACRDAGIQLSPLFLAKMRAQVVAGSDRRLP